MVSQFRLKRSAFNKFQFHFESNEFVFLQPRFPFDWKTPLGYLFAFSSQCLEAYTSIASVLPMICFLAGSCWLFVCFAKDVTYDLSLFNVNSNSAGNDKGRMKQQLCKIIKLHGNLKELSEIILILPFLIYQVFFRLSHIFMLFRLIDDFNVIIEFVILVLFLWSLLVICIALMIIQTELVEFSPFQTDCNQWNWISNSFFAFAKVELESELVGYNDVVAYSLLGPHIFIFLLWIGRNGDESIQSVR